MKLALTTAQPAPGCWSRGSMAPREVLEMEMPAALAQHGAPYGYYAALQGQDGLQAARGAAFLWDVRTRVLQGVSEMHMAECFRAWYIS